MDDYIEREKFKPKCIRCRVERLLRCTEEYTLEIYSKGNIYLNPEIQTVYISDRKIHLTISETKILKHLLKNDKYCTTDELRTLLSSSIKGKSVCVFINRLIKKMRYTFGYSVIKNKYKRGYYIDY